MSAAWFVLGPLLVVSHAAAFFVGRREERIKARERLYEYRQKNWWRGLTNEEKIDFAVADGQGGVYYKRMFAKK